MCMEMNSFNQNDLRMNRFHNHENPKSYLIKVIIEDISILINLLATYFFKFIIWIIGWKQLNSAICEKAKLIDKAIVIFPHTSSWDFIVLILYKFSNPVVFNDIFIVVKPQFLNGPLKNIFKYLKCIPATKYESKGGGFIKTTVNMFKNEVRFFIMISPEGRRIKTPWQSGYYQLAEKLKCPVYIVGTCYYRKEIMLLGPFIKNTVECMASDSNEDIKSFEDRIKSGSSLIVPLIPKNKFVSVSQELLNKIPNKTPTLIDKKKVIYRIIFIYLLWLLKRILAGVAT